jgi:lipopolysaccharide/colanic/teichoic acid biosynthesis glycosyltransferase
MDVWYVDHLSFLIDMKVIFLSIEKVFKREGINSSNSATMEAFTGNN